MWTKLAPRAPGFYWFRALKGQANGGGYGEPQVCAVWHSKYSGDTYIMYIGTDTVENVMEPDHFCLFWPEAITPPPEYNPGHGHQDNSTEH